ncbi:TetR/AcrR family transcriptional regulator C-terminal domain-containing protein [Microlunatus ginsengisoli]|uniref:TetR/AcrR family transcriptional regulator C-terminal domain-containing protein n=1 Tax=Microlunatus ginsengisoli TaxID=363863 RepID=A0ABP6ZGQ6_9ACTN
MPLDRHRIVDEALRLVDESGLDALSLRSLAGRLDVRAPTLYWHVQNKSELLDALADEIMDGAIDSARRISVPGDARAWLLEALGGLRSAMLGHRDGARIVSGSRNSMRRADFSELAMATLVAGGLALRRARLLVLVGERYTVGWVLEEQAPAPESPAPDLDVLRARLPTVTAAIADYFDGTGRGADDLYRDGARLLLGLAN